jgi:hypothetical protein
MKGCEWRTGYLLVCGTSPWTKDGVPGLDDITPYPHEVVFCAPR